MPNLKKGYISLTDNAIKLKKLKTAITVILIVFIISFIGLAARIVYVSFYYDRGATVVVPDNIVESKEAAIISRSSKLCIRPTVIAAARAPQATVVELYLGHAHDNEKFDVKDMLPGDTVEKYFCLKVHHDADVSVYFKVTDVAETKSLGNILNVKVTRIDSEPDEVLCDGSFSGVKDKQFETVLTASAANETVAYYKIEVSLPTSAGNEYQAASLSAKFNWYAENPDTPPHTCESKCPQCGKCLDKACTETACANKCPGHSLPPIIPPTPSHSCESKCPECGKCLDKICTEAVCADKCQGHVPPHECESKCPECGKCLDKDCAEDACADKCQGHVPPHECESKCPECGKCLDKDCTDDVCTDKCQGHIPPHECESKCPECGKCLDKDCTDDACADKCQGHTPPPPAAHECESECPECGKCLDKECTDPACEEKCEGHGSPLLPKPRPIIWPWTILPALSLLALIILLILYFKIRKVIGNE